MQMHQLTSPDNNLLINKGYVYNSIFYSTIESDLGEECIAFFFNISCNMFLTLS